MLTVAKLFKSLSYGQLSNLSIGNSGSGDIRTEDQNKIINYLNEGLTRIYSRFNLLEKDVLISQTEYITNYHLDKRFAVNNPERLDIHYPYILDLPNEKFNDDVIKILSVRDVLGRRLPLNDQTNQASVFTPYPTTLQVPYPQTDAPLNIQYQAAHPKLEYSVKEAEVVVPTVLENALLSMVAYLVYSHMNTQEATGKAAEHMAMYEAICTEIEEQGTASINAASTQPKFHRNGWR